MISRRPRALIAKVGLCAFSTAFAFAVAEGTLRICGQQPGFISAYKDFKKVQTLAVSESFRVDPSGIISVNIDCEEEWITTAGVNAQGFRGEDFSIVEKSDKKKILFIGDSFTWGASAEPITSSFVDIVSQSGYAVFNTGISGTGPSQYANVAEKYIPALRPDIVAVIFFMGNDIRIDPPLSPGQTLYHVTNVGWLYAFDSNGTYMDADAAYHHYIKRSNMIKAKRSNVSLKNVIKNGLTRSVVGTYIWMGLNKTYLRLLRLEKKQNESFNADNRINEKNKEVCRLLNDIQILAHSYASDFKLFIVPGRPSRISIHNDIAYNRDVFEGLDPLCPQNLKEDDYRGKNDSHFNNKGHRKFADFILHVLHNN